MNFFSSLVSKNQHILTDPLLIQFAYQGNISAGIHFLYYHQLTPSPPPLSRPNPSPSTLSFVDAFLVKTMAFPNSFNPFPHSPIDDVGVDVRMQPYFDYFDYQPWFDELDFHFHCQRRHQQLSHFSQTPSKSHTIDLYPYVRLMSQCDLQRNPNGRKSKRHFYLKVDYTCLLGIVSDEIQERVHWLKQHQHCLY
jgi:hypothetical protein